jgi:DNA-binding response OmpR family regulator
MNTILLLIKDLQYSNEFKRALELIKKCIVHTFSNGKEGLKIDRCFNINVIVTDIKMSEPDIMDMAEKIGNENESIPILLTLSQPDNQIVLQDDNRDADHVNTKPHSGEELDDIQDVSACSSACEEKNVVRLGKYIFDADKQTLQYEGYERTTTETETKILEILHKQIGKVVLRKDILKCVWNRVDEYTSRILDVYIYQLRKHLSQDPAVKIRTVWGKGHLLSVDE